MAKKKTGGALGTGLSAIFGEGVEDVLKDINSPKMDEYGYKTVLNVKEIRPNPYQPRRVFDQEKLEELAKSIEQQGVFTPILVRKTLTGYELIAGERRLKASKIAKKTTIPAIVVDFDDQAMMEVSLLENIQREDLNVVEEAMAYDKLMKSLKCTQEELAEKIGKSRAHIANILRLLKLPKEVLNLVESGKLSMGHARALVTLEKEKAINLAQKAVNDGLSVREIEKLANPQAPTVKKVTEKKQDPYMKDVVKSLEDKYSTKVKVTNNSITISYDGVDDLNRLLELLGIIE